MVDVALPGGRVTSVRRLRGGLDAYVHAAGVALPGGARVQVVLRRRGAAASPAARRRIVAEFRTLGVLEVAGVPAPRPILLDAEGQFFGGPSILMSYAGRPIVAPRSVDLWLADLAAALLSLRAVTPERFDLTYLPTLDLERMRRRVAYPLPGHLAADPLAGQVAATLRERLAAVAWSEPCLVHEDFWPGNTVWRGQRLRAIVDWSTAAVGDPRIDLAQCRADLAMMHGAEIADAFLEACRARAAGPLADIWYFDLLVGLSALGSFRHWLAGYHDVGLVHLTEGILEERLRAFLARSLP